MFICPVCKTENETLLCKNCGFDGSCDFENYATLSMVPENLKAVSSLKYERQKMLETYSLCPNCGGYTFYLNKKDFTCVCANCNTPLKDTYFVNGLFKDNFIKNNKVSVTNKKEYRRISAGLNHTVVVLRNRRAAAVGDNEDGQCNVDSWEDIISVSAGNSHTVGLKSDGTVVAAGDNSHGQCNVGNWKDIVSVCAGSFHTVGLKRNGTVVATGWNVFGQCGVEGWRGIIDIAAGDSHTIGLRSDGTVVAVGNEFNGSCDVEDWKNVTSVYAGGMDTAAITRDGKVLTTDGKEKEWKNIALMEIGSFNIAGLKNDGTVIVRGSNDEGQCDVGNWKNIIDIGRRFPHGRA